MRGRRSVVTFLLALTAFVGIGGGAALLLLPGEDAARAPRQAAAATPVPAPTEEPAAAEEATPEPPAEREFALLSDAPSVPRPGQPNRLVIPSIALDAKVVEVGLIVENGKPAWDTAAFAVGFHRGSAQPGQRGNSVMAGHISSPVSKKGDIFRRLPEVRIGDRVDVYVGDRRVTYEVSEIKIVPPMATEVLNQTEDATLTLITCYPNWVYNKRLVVIGKLTTDG